MTPPEDWPAERREAYRRSRAVGLELLALPLVIVGWVLAFIGGAHLLAAFS